MKFEQANKIIEKAKEEIETQQNYGDFKIMFCNFINENKYIIEDSKSKYCWSFGESENEIKLLIDLLCKRYCNYAIEHHSQMTDISVYFISNDKELLKKYKFLYDYLLNYAENGETYSIVYKEILDKGIKIINSEMIENENEIDLLEIIESFSYRF